MVASGTSHQNVNNSDEQRVRVAWLVLIWGLLVAPIVISLIEPAMAPSDDVPRQVDQVATDSGSAATRALVFGINLLMLGVAAGAIVLASRMSRSLSSGFLLWFGVIAFSAGPIVASFSNTGLFLSPDVVRIPLFFTAAYLLPPVNLEWFIKQCKSAIELYVMATIAAIVVAPRMVIQFNYDASVIDAFPFRLHGIANHVNVFAPMLVLYLILGWIVPARSPYERTALVVVLGTLLMTQSKTAILAAVILYVIRMFYTEGARRYVAAYSSSVATVAGLLLLTIVRPTWDRDLVDTLIADNEYTTLTGRTDLWNHSLDLWREQPIVGFGPELWYIEMSVNHAARFYWVAHHAHNQVVQTLGVSGLVGLAGLVIFAFVLLAKAVQLRRLTSGVSIALVVFLFMRSFTEVPLTGLLDESLFVLFVTFTVMLFAESQSGPASEPEEDGARDDGEDRESDVSLREQVLRELERESVLRRGGGHEFV